MQPNDFRNNRECNSTCGCGPECVNRVAGQIPRVSVRRLIENEDAIQRDRSLLCAFGPHSDPGRHLLDWLQRLGFVLALDSNQIDIDPPSLDRRPEPSKLHVHRLGR